MTATDATFLAEDRQFMAEAIELARRGQCSTTPNPCVGCVLVKEGVVVGRGWHRRAGEAHAEVNAIADAGAAARGATAYISLEPCAVVGRTGACCESLQQAGVARVISAMEDPNPQVAGGGHRHLEASGIAVSSGLMSEQAAALNRGYIRRMSQQRPRVRCKMAMSLDGRTAMASGESQWITGAESRHEVQRLRAESCAIVTGVGTILADDPAMTVRSTVAADVADDGASDSAPRQPLLVVLDSSLQTPPSATVVVDCQRLSRSVMIVCAAAAADDKRAALQAYGVEVVELPRALDEAAGLDLAALLDLLAQREINEVLVEAGAVLAGGFLAAGLLDEVLLFVAPKLLGSSARALFDISLESMAEAQSLKIEAVSAVGDDWLLRCTPSQVVK